MQFYCNWSLIENHIKAYQWIEHWTMNWKKNGKRKNPFRSSYYVPRRTVHRQMAFISLPFESNAIKGKNKIYLSNVMMVWFFFLRFHGISVCGSFALVTLHMLFCMLLYNKCAMVNQFKEFFKFTHQMTHNRYNLIGICVDPFFLYSH